MLKSLMARIVFVAVAAMSAILVLFILANGHAVAHMRRQAVQSQEALLELYAAQMDQSLEALRIGMVQRATDDLSLNALCFYDPEGIGYQLRAQECKKWLNQSLQVNPLMASYYLRDDGTGLLLTASQALASSRHLYIRSHLAQFVQDTGEPGSSAWAQVFTAGYLNESDAPGWLLVKCVPVSDRVTLGAAVAVDALIPPLEQVMPYPGMITQIYAGGGQLLAQSPGASDGLQTRVAPHLTGQDSAFSVQDAATGEKYIAISRALRTASVRVVTLLPERAVLQELRVFQYIGAGLPVLLAALTALAAAAIPALYRPFGELTRIMEGVAAGDLSLRLPPGRTPEFRTVNARFNEMVERIDQLNRDVQEQTLRRHRAELKHLQAQINPHFYQNTLNLIYNLAALQQYELIQRTALYLADYFRFIMRSGAQPIRLRDELTHINNYMQLQSIRYPNAIEYRCHADPSLLDAPLLPLLIQPFVENSMIHGFTTRRPFCVEVRVLRAGRRMAVEVEDSGKGIPPCVARELNRMMDEDGENSEHIGVRNVVTRLKSAWGGEATLRFEENRPCGALVRMELPLPEEKEVRL